MTLKSLVQLQLLRQLQEDGFLTADAASEAQERYLDADADSSSPPFPSTTAAGDGRGSLLTISNCIKATAILFLLVALTTFVTLLSPWLAKAPIEIYQVPMLAASLFMMMRPQLIWQAQAPYIAVLSTFSSLIILTWIAYSHDTFVHWLDTLEESGWPVASLLSAIVTAFFAGTAILHESQVLAVASAIMLTPALVGDSEGAVLSRLVFGHLLAVVAHITLKAGGSHPKLTFLFAFAVEYYCTLALAVSLCVTVDPWDQFGIAVLYTLLFALILGASGLVYYILGIKTHASILSCTTIPMLLIWLTYATSSLGTVVTLLLCGVALYGSGMLLDKHRAFLVFEVPRFEPSSPITAPALGPGYEVMSVPLVSPDTASHMVDLGDSQRFAEC